MKKLWLFLVLLCLSSTAFAKAEKGVQIEVDVDAENSVVAKEKALIEAQRKGLLQITSRYTDEKNVQKLEQLSDEEIVKFVQSVGVADEKAGGTKYKAVFTVEINEDLLKDYMAENDMIDVETAELLVIPVYRGSYESQIELWENSNEWRQKWLSKGFIKFGTLQVRTIDNRFEHLSELNGESALYMGSSLYDRISQINGSDRIYVVYAEVLPNKDLKITVKNERAKTEETFSVLYDENIFDKAIEKSVMFISNMERDAKKQDGIENINVVSAVYTYQNMKEWIETSKAMLDLQNIKSIDTKSIGNGKVNFDLHYEGSLDDLYNALPEIGLSYKNMGNYIIIR